MKKYLLIMAMAFLCMPAAEIMAQDAADKAVAPVARDMPAVDITVQGKGGMTQVFHVEVALTDEDQANGLMGRREMAANAGMLFFFGEEKPRYFWMKDTLIPLDMLFIRKDGTISHIHPNARPLDESAVASEGPVAAVLELNGGTVALLGIGNGDKVINGSYFNNKSPASKNGP